MSHDHTHLTASLQDKEGPVPGHYWQGLNTHKVSMSLHSENRQRLCERLRKVANLPSNSVVVLQGAGDVSINDTDTDYLFRQEGYFLWAFGVDHEAGCFGTIDVSSGKSILYVPRLPEDHAVWLGTIHPPAHFKEKYLVDEVKFVDEIAATLKATPDCTVLLLKGVNTDSGLAAKTAAFEGSDAFKTNTDILYNNITECRVFKSQKEIEVLRYVAGVSSDAHKLVMRAVRPGMKEYQCESIFMNHCYQEGGCRHMCYTCICASGHNGSYLHYGHMGAPNDKTLRDGDMCLFDMGAEYHGYCSDITVSFPVSGKFTPDQKAVYEAVLDAQQAVVKAMRPGVAWPDMHRLAELTILRHLVTLGLLHNGTPEEMAAAFLGYVFMPHGLGHLLGIQVHDVGGYPEGGVARIDEPGVKKLRTARVLEEGLYITVEPGCYFIDILLDKALKDPVHSKFINADVLKRFRGFGGVRLEDDVIVTKDGCEVLSNVPRTVAEVEAWLAQKN
eukprot:TRINITY_DN1980_c0_g1_i1.p1 TRINITY_DN1980_c0_g1~~TRINITY_DN1980_c0_g1_i1.p1  ORF type:complete len:501 (+),score=140.99 TRINITY_DN1980_c0_g1_i1:33-1535(+)